GRLGELKQLFSAVGVNHSAADVEDWTARFADLLNGSLDLERVSARAWAITWKPHTFGVNKTHILCGDVLGDVNEHRARSASACYVKCFFNYFGQVADIFHKVVVLCARPCDANGVGFLKRVRADYLSWDLS